MEGKAAWLLGATWHYILTIAVGLRWSGSSSCLALWEPWVEIFSASTSLLRWEESLSPWGRGPGGGPGGPPALGVAQNLTAEQLLGLHPVRGGPWSWLACDDSREPVTRTGQRAAGEPWPLVVAGQQEGSVVCEASAWLLVDLSDFG